MLPPLDNPFRHDAPPLLVPVKLIRFSHTHLSAALARAQKPVLPSSAQSSQSSKTGIRKILAIAPKIAASPFPPAVDLLYLRQRRRYKGHSS
jgi:hypothetical protein